MRPPKHLLKTPGLRFGQSLYHCDAGTSVWLVWVLEIRGQEIPLTCSERNLI